MNCYKIWVDIIIPLVSAFIGGGITLWGVFLTIKYESKKSRKEYLEKIRPFFVVENENLKSIDVDSIKKIWVNDDSSKELKEVSTIFHWDSLVLSNVCDNVCMMSYIKINNEQYASFENIPIKSGECCEIKGCPLSSYINEKIDNISLGVLDREFNIYEYELKYRINDCKVDNDNLKNYGHKIISFYLIDCGKNLTKRSRRK